MNESKYREKSSIKTNFTIDRRDKISFKNPDFLFNNNSKINYNYIEINENIRIEIIDWIIKMCFKWELNLIGLCRSISIFDTYISKINNTNIEELKFFAIISIYLSSKWEEVSPLILKDIYNYVFKKVYTINYLKIKEIEFLNKIEFNTNSTLLIDYLNYFLNLKYLKEYLNNNEDLLNSVKKNSSFLLKIVLFYLDILKKHNFLEISISIIYLSLKILKSNKSNIKFFIKNIIFQFNVDKKIILNTIKKIYNFSLKINKNNSVKFYKIYFN